MLHSLSSNKKILFLVLIGILLISLPLTLYLLQKQQETRSKAELATTLFFEPQSTSASPIQKNVNDIFSVNMVVNPGQNQISLVKFEITYDATKITALGTKGFTSNTTAFPVTVEGPFITEVNNVGKIQGTVSIGSDYNKAITSQTTVGSIEFKAKASTSTQSTQINFSTNTQVLSLGTSDQASENVLSSTSPAYINILPAITPCSFTPSTADIMMIVDISGSTLDNRTSQKTAMKNFVDSVIANNSISGQYRIGLISYASTARLNFSLQNGTDYNGLKNAIDNMPFIDNASTGEAEAVRLSTNEFTKYGRSGVRKAVILLTDRIDSYTNDAANDAYNIHKTAFYVLAYDITNSTIRRMLQDLASRTGGTYHEYTGTSGPSENQLLQDLASDVTCPTVTPTNPSPTPTPTPTPTSPTLTFTAAQTSLNYNGSTTLSWNSTNASSCTASGGWSGTKALSGTESTGPLTSSKIYVLTCTGPGGSVTKSVTVTVALPTPTPTRTPTPTPTPIPTNTPVPTNTPIPQATKFKFIVYLHGLGNSGDNRNPTAHSLSNKNPIRQQRSLDIEVLATGVTREILLKKSFTTGLTYNAAQGYFEGIVDMGTTLQSGIYNINIHTYQYLWNSFAGIQITAGQTNTFPSISLVTGDINNDDQLDILDYNILAGCYSDFAPAVSCPATVVPSTPFLLKDMADLTDDGKVNQFDYNLFLREYSVQNSNRITQ